MSTGRIGRMLMKCDTRTIKEEQAATSEDSNHHHVENLINFTKIPKLQSLTLPENLTKNSLDSSLTLDKLIQCVDGGKFKNFQFLSLFL